LAASAVSLISDNATQTLYKRARAGGNDYEGYDYEPPEEGDADAFLCIYEPGYSDRGRDLPEIRNGRIITETPLNLRDMIFTTPDASIDEGQEVTGVNQQFDFDGSVYGYEVFF
jgi:hypothetical protein